MKRILLLAVGTALLVGDLPDVIAQDNPPGDPMEGYRTKWAAEGAMYLTGLALDVGGLVFAIGNGAGILKDVQPRAGWVAGGWVSGLLNLGSGIALLVFEYGDSPLRNVGISNLIMGTLDIGLAFWASTRPTEEEKNRYQLTPLVIQDAKGNPSLGLGVRVIGW
jgi:hypothetical protein